MIMKKSNDNNLASWKVVSVPRGSALPSDIVACIVPESDMDDSQLVEGLRKTIGKMIVNLFGHDLMYERSPTNILHKQFNVLYRNSNISVESSAESLHLRWTAAQLLEKKAFSKADTHTHPTNHNIITRWEGIIEINFQITEQMLKSYNNKPTC